jgi:hypothetical protein
MTMKTVLTLSSFAALVGCSTLGAQASAPAGQRPLADFVGTYEEAPGRTLELVAES